MAQTATPINDSIFHDGVYRKYVLYVPAIYNPADSVPLILNIHGGSGDGYQHMQFGDFRPIADTANFIVVHPTAMMGAGLLGSAPAPSWNLNANDSASNSDRAFLYNLIDTLRAQYNIDTNRIYSAGFSQGGVMGYSFACLNNTRFAAIASVSAGMFPDVYNICSPTRPTPVIEIHGTSDPISNYDGAASAFGTPPSKPVDTVIIFWVNYNNCNPTPTIINIPNAVTSDNSTVEHYIYSGGDSSSSVELIKVIGGGHSWPSDVATGGTTNMNNSPMQVGNRNMDFNACKEIWRFFCRHPFIEYPAVPPTGVANQTPGDNLISVYPNPSNGSFVLSVELVEPDTRVQLINLLGETIFQKSITESHTPISLEKLTSGVLLYTVINNHGVVKSGKIIIR
mgnify:CR=1 FL=1